MGLSDKQIDEKLLAGENPGKFFENMGQAFLYLSLGAQRGETEVALALLKFIGPGTRNEKGQTVLRKGAAKRKRPRHCWRRGAAPGLATGKDGRR